LWTAESYRKKLPTLRRHGVQDSYLWITLYSMVAFNLWLGATSPILWHWQQMKSQQISPLVIITKPRQWVWYLNSSTPNLSQTSAFSVHLGLAL
jgi:hypothetical protein